eukprot:scaffold13087_cov70-Skeletonema_marinoi.AAC.1
MMLAMRSLLPTSPTKSNHTILYNRIQNIIYQASHYIDHCTMGFGRPRRDSAGASMERALRALSPRGSVRALTNKASSTSAELKNASSRPSLEMKSSSAAEAPDNHLQGTETEDGEEEAVKVAIRIRPLANHNDPQV